MFDYHVHTNFSADSEMKMADACRQAVQAGVREIAFTEHIDCFYPDDELVWGFDYNDYSQTIEKLRGEFAPKLQIIKGIEVGLHPLGFEPSRQFTGLNSFDFIIGSVHIVGNQDLHNGEFFRGRSIAGAVETYYQAVNSCVKEYTEFNVLGHLDLIKRYLYHMHCTADQINWQQHDECNTDTLRRLVETGRGIELNTSGYNSGLNCCLPDKHILELYRKVGGEIVTVGSDAHTPERIGAQLALGYKLLQETGFKYIATFRGRKPQFIPLSEVI